MKTHYGERPGMVEGEGAERYAAVRRLVRRAEGAARWAAFARRAARDFAAVCGPEAAQGWRERAEKIEARAARLRALASEAVNANGRV